MATEHALSTSPLATLFEKVETILGMACCGPVAGVMVAVLFVAMGYYLYTPVPSDIANPTRLQVMTATLRLITLIGRVGEKLGLANHVTFQRYLMNYLKRPVSQDYQDLEVTDTTFEGVPVRIYQPKSAPKLSPAVVYYHGGGWALGSVDMYDRLTANLAKQSGMVVVSVEYRLAPEHPFPIPFEDCVRATIHLLHNGQRYGVDPSRVAIAGDSAGGNLAAAVSLRLSEEAEDYLPRIKLQVLVYPVMQGFTFTLPSYRKHGHLFLTHTAMAEYWLAYMGLGDSLHLVTSLLTDNHTSPLLKKSEYAKAVSLSALPLEFQPKENEVAETKGGNYGDEELSARLEPILTNPYISPLMASSVKAVAPAVVFVAEKDILCDEGLMYYEKLRRAGVTVHLEYEPAGFHACFSQDFELGQKWLAKVAEYLNKYV